MIVLCIRTDTETATVGLFAGDELKKIEWSAGRELSKTILTRIEELLEAEKLDKSQIEGVILYKGPGSFTGLRIGASVANAINLGLSVPIVNTNGENWIVDGYKKLEAGKNDKFADIEYGGEANITKPKK